MNHFIVRSIIGCSMILMLIACGESSKIWNPDQTPRLLEVPDVEVTTEFEDGLADASLFSLPKLDLLFVIDDSGSMASHQERLAANAPRMMRIFDSVGMLDYHIGVITSTSYGSGGSASGNFKGYPMYIDRSLSEPIKYLMYNVMVGTSGSGIEIFFDNIYDTIKWVIGHPGVDYYREDAYFVTIILTDTEDQSRRLGARDLYDFLLDLKGGDPTKVSAYAAVIPTGFKAPTDCRREGSVEPKKLEEFVTMTGGTFFNLCDRDFGYNLAEVADRIVSRLDRWVQLEYPPIPETVEVFYGGLPLKKGGRDGWSYDPTRNALVFGDLFQLPDEAPVGSEFSVTYDRAVVKSGK